MKFVNVGFGQELFVNKRFKVERQTIVCVLCSMNPDPLERHTFWSLTIGGTFTWLAIYGVNQAQIQRALCTPTMREGQL
jgi:hypothetical protein